MPVKRGTKYVARVKKNGQVNWLGTYDTKREARSVEAEFKWSKAAITSDVTCDVFAETWVDNYPRPKETTDRHNRERIKKFAEDFKGVKLKDVDRPTARAWASENRSRAQTVAAMFTDALNDGLISVSPFKDLRLAGRRGRRDLIALREQEVQELANIALEINGPVMGPTIRSMVLVAAYVGCRPGELYALERSDINGSFVSISRQINSMRKIDTPKNHRSREIIFPPQAQQTVTELPIHLTGPMFQTVRGKYFYGALFSDRYWRPLRAAFGKPEMDFYELRHFCATYLLELGVSHADVAYQLGHTDGGGPSYVDVWASLGGGLSRTTVGCL